MILQLYFWPIFLFLFVFLNSHLTKVEGKLGEQGNKHKTNELIVKLLQDEIDQHTYNPLTVWLIQENDLFPTNYSEDSDLLQLYFSNPNSVPAIQGLSFGKQIRLKHLHLSSFIFFIVVPSQLPSNVKEQNVQSSDSHSEILEEVEKAIKKNGNQRRDRFIFIGEDETILQKLFRTRIFLGLKEKIGISVLQTRDEDKITLFFDPQVYSKDGDMLKIGVESVEQSTYSKFRPLMGRNLPGRHIRITGCLLPTWLYIVSTSPDGKPEYDGSNYRTFVEMSNKFNFTFEVHAPVGQGYGALINGTWTGMVSDIIYTERNFDIAILLGHVLTWFPFVDFASVLDFAKLQFVTTQPKLEIPWDSFILPYKNSVWLALIGSCGLMSLVTFIFLVIKKLGMEHACMTGTRKFQYSGNLNLTHHHDQSYLSILYTALCLPYAIALEQSFRVPHTARILSAIWLTITIITGTGYKSNLASYLSFPSAIPVPTSYEELAAQTDYKVILNNLGVAEKVFFETSDAPTIQTIAKRLQLIPDTIECTAKAFTQEKTACIAWTPLITAFSSLNLTIDTRLYPLLMSREPALPVSMTVGFVKNSPIVDAMTPIIASIHETGIYGVWTDAAYYHFRLQGKKNLDLDLQQTDGRGSNPELYEKLKEYAESVGSLGVLRPFSMKNLKLPFYGLGIGVLFSVAGFAAEFFVTGVKCYEEGDEGGSEIQRIERIQRKLKLEDDYASKGLDYSTKIFVISQLGDIDNRRENAEDRKN